MMKDDEVSGAGNSYTTEFRQYDPRLGRWMSLDPLFDYFPDVSPYISFDNNPIYFTDPDGLAPKPPKSNFHKRKGHVKGNRNMHKEMEIKHKKSGTNPNDDDSKGSRMTLGASIGHVVRNIKNWSQRTFGDRESYTQTIRLGGWQQSDWNTRFDDLVTGSQSMFFNLSMAPGSRLTNVRTTIDRGTSVFGNLNFVTTLGNRIGNNQFGTIFGSPGMSFPFLYSFNRWTFTSGANTSMLPFMQALRNYTLGRITSAVFGGAIDVFNTFLTVAGIDIVSSRINPAFRNTSMIQLNVYTAGQVNAKIEFKYKYLVHKPPTLFQRMFTLNF
jgi:RHS repeat-associated protein